MNVAEQEIKDLRKRTEAFLNSETPKLWKSIQERNEASDENLKRKAQEFFELPKAAEDRVASSMDRRGFFKWMTAASALVTSSACQRRPKDYLVPYVRKPKGLTYGVPVWYASSSPNGLGVLVKTREGRPIKLEGNPDHPMSRGGLDAVTQAEILNLYNPERLREPVEVSSGKKLSWDEVDSRVQAALSNMKAGGLRMISADIPSPSLKKAKQDFLKKYSGQNITYRANSYYYIQRAYEIAMGKSWVPYIEFEKADVILNIDADFLGTWLRPVEFTKSFTKRRNAHRGDLNQNRLITFESMMSITGISSDERYAIKPSQQLPLLLTLINELSTDLSFDASLLAAARVWTKEKFSETFEMPKEVIEGVAKALLSARSKAVVLSGGFGEQALEAQLASIAINEALQAYGNVIPWNTGISVEETSSLMVDELIRDMNEAKVEVLVLHSVNPVYSSLNKNFVEAIKKVPFVVFVGHSKNETSEFANLALPESHFLECWGDSEAIFGTRAVQQPVIDPIFSSRCFLESLLRWSGDSKTLARDFVRSSWMTGGLRSEGEWMDQLKIGAFQYSTDSNRANFRWSGAAASIQAVESQNSSGLELVAYESVALRDGEHANNALLQELPDPVSKVTWDNFAALSPKKAKELGVHQNDVVQIRVREDSISLPVFILPGLRSDVVAVAVGYGRSVAGSVGTNVGANVYPFRSIGKNSLSFLSGLSAEVVSTGRREELASTQHHFDIHGRDADILNQATLAEFIKSPRVARGKYAKKEPDDRSMYQDHPYPGHRWGLNVDMNKCTGCNACVTACYSENNIAMSGKKEVAYGRHMAWIRLDLYHSGDEQNPESTFQPMLCQHCERAPCETVCPVLATVHSSDGLNDMIYNRCVGTRYCANNCPYKVRRFNYFQYSDSLGGKMDVDFESPLSLMLNPDVTTRTRGVMEKCTFCVQRIRRGVDEEKAEQGKAYRHRIEDGKIKTACQQSCPAEAIVFGDLNDPQSQVTELSQKAQSYKVLSVLNTNPAVTYMPRIRNKGIDA